MRAVQIDRHGGPDALIVREIAEPALAPGEVIIRAAASSLNPVDWKTRAWQVGPRLPATLGRDLAGRVVAANDTAQEGGAPVIAMSAQIATGRGTWSDLVTLPGHLLAPAPSSIALADSASLPLTGTTALQALRSARTVAGERILVIGAAGAVGGLAVQLAHLAKLIDTHELRLRVAECYPLDDIRSAYERFEAGGLIGKVLITF
ncbi:zinc-binding dehydrogenase [Streptomyces sp. WMMC500]|uniref:alcohol dehydrogenase catalytic domain-containing protein n=1 Tax=Streptomyces sp. WMMC500 TaxID=3015154 RepID=UPI00248D0F04|nr:zinc-binding dehydrogenase [Streptomyces sp. WMMC500]WBB59743.1 zinc-binding dehydrogenase [Streptomyces sp. WMMC500]